MNTVSSRPRSGAAGVTDRRGESAVTLWALLVAYVVLFLLIASPRDVDVAENLSALLSTGLWLALGVWTLAVNHRVPRHSWLVATVLAVLVALSNTTGSFTDSGSPVTPILTFLAVLACGSALDRYPHAMAPLLRDSTPRGAVTTLGIGLAAGITLGLINAALLRWGQHQPLAPSLDSGRVLATLRPAIFEEIAQRALAMALAVSVLGGRPRTRWTWTSMIGLMSVPHLLPHLAGTVQQPVISVAVVGLVLFVFFSVPFVILQVRRDVTTAMLAHGAVDLVRFVLFG